MESGSATAVVAATGEQTYFGRMASSMTGPEVKTSFDEGMHRFTLLMIQFIPGDGTARFSDQRFDQTQLGRCIFLLDRCRGRINAGDAADDRLCLLVEWRARDVEEKGHREASKFHSKPGCNGRSLHRQNRHTYA